MLATAKQIPIIHAGWKTRCRKKCTAMQKDDRLAVSSTSEPMELLMENVASIMRLSWLGKGKLLARKQISATQRNLKSRSWCARVVVNTAY